LIEDITIAELCCGNRDAEEMLMCFARICHTWDDLIDKDKPVSDREINIMMWRALIELPKNPFYLRNINEIIPHAATSCILQWMASNELEEDSPDIANIIRDGITVLYLHVALLCGGPEHAMKNCARIMKSFRDSERIQDGNGTKQK
jgi:hypothetical protein